MHKISPGLGSWSEEQHGKKSEAGVRAARGKGLACCPKKYGLCLEGNRELERVLKRAHLEQLLWLHYREWSVTGNVSGRDMTSWWPQRTETHWVFRALKPDCLGSNPTSITYWLYDFRQIALISFASISSSVKQEYDSIHLTKSWSLMTTHVEDFDNT